MRSRRGGEENLPWRAPDKSEDPSSESATPDDVHSNRKGPINIMNECVVETKALRRDIGPGGLEGEQEAMDDVEDDLDHQNVIEGGGHDGIWWGKNGATSTACHNSK